MGLFGASYEWGGTKKFPLSKTCHTYPTMMKLGTVVYYLKKSRKYINHMTQLFVFADISIFCQKVATFVISKNTDVD